jgi:hypothetical protein
VDEKEKMAIARVKMSLTMSRHISAWKSPQTLEITFDSQSTNMIKMITVYMRVYPEESTGDRSYCVTEISWERDACRRCQKTDRPFRQRTLPILFGKIVSSSRMPCVQFINASTYSGAGSFVGRLNLMPSSQRYSYLPDMG